jgi:ABC-2 type transport system ATP-binding protein
MIELHGAGCRIGGRWVVRDVSLEVQAGEVFGITGPNGSGKSVLLAICATLVRADAGTARVAGLDVRTATRAVRRLIGFVPEEVGWDPRLTVREDLEFFAAAHALPRRTRSVAATDVLQRWDLGPVAGERMGRLSRGFLRRVGLARAWLHRPRVLLLDEPACGLDVETRSTLWRELELHAEGGGSALVVSHDVEHLSRACRRIGVMAAGQLGEVIEAWGAPSPV